MSEQQMERIEYALRSAGAGATLLDFREVRAELGRVVKDERRLREDLADLLRVFAEWQARCKKRVEWPHDA